MVLAGPSVTETDLGRRDAFPAAEWNIAERSLDRHDIVEDSSDNRTGDCALYSVIYPLFTSSFLLIHLYF